MKIGAETVGIVALKQKAEGLRRIARDLGFTFTESPVQDEAEAIRFTFELIPEETERLLRVVPRDVFAMRAYLL